MSVAEGTRVEFGPPLLGAALRMASEALQIGLLEQLHAAGFDDMSRALVPVMRWPGPQGRRPSEIAADLGISKQALNYLLRQLEDAGYIERRADGDDARSRTVELTAHGVALARAMRAAVKKVERQLAREVGTADVEQIQVLLGRLNATTYVRQRSGPNRG